MAWTVIEQMSEAGRHPNEDGAGVAGDLAWIADGAGTPYGTRFAAWGSDAAWLVAAAGEHLRRAGREPAGDCDLGQCLADLQQHLAMRYGAASDDDPAGGPTSCLGLMRATVRDQVLVDISAAVLADVVLLVPTGHGIEAWTDERVKPFEARTFAAMGGLARIDGALPVVAWEQIMRNRAAVNRPGGYAAVSPARPFTHLAHHFEATIECGVPVVAMTDGFYRLHDVFGAYSVTSLYEACASGGAWRLMRELRDIERSDPQAERHQRFKVHDDATVLVVACEG